MNISEGTFVSLASMFTANYYVSHAFFGVYRETGDHQVCKSAVVPLINTG